MFKAIIFDWDGTLADTKQVIVNSFQNVLTEIGCYINDDFIKRRIGVGPRKILKEALCTQNIPFDEKTIDRLEKEKVEIQIEVIDTITLFDGVIELLTTLKNNFKVALATMSNRKVIEKALKAKNIGQYFDIVIAFEEVNKPKPDPEIFLKCATKLGCHPETCVVLEDSIFGVIAAKKANMTCIAISSGAYSKNELKEAAPDLIVDAIHEKNKILSFLFSQK